MVKQMDHASPWLKLSFLLLWCVILATFWFKRSKHALRLNSSPETLLYSTFPALSHVYLRTSPGTTNTDVLFSILLHRFSVLPYFAPHMLNRENSRIFEVLKRGQSRMGPWAGVRRSSVVTQSSLLNLKTCLRLQTFQEPKLLWESGLCLWVTHSESLFILQ